jgi:hypothetical protein
MIRKYKKKPFVITKADEALFSFIGQATRVDNEINKDKYAQCIKKINTTEKNDKKN